MSHRGASFSQPPRARLPRSLRKLPLFPRRSLAGVIAIVSMFLKSTWFRVKLKLARLSRPRSSISCAEQDRTELQKFQKGALYGARDAGMHKKRSKKLRSVAGS